MTHHSTTASTRAHPYDAMRVRPCRTLTVVLYTEPRCSSYVRSERFVAVGAAARRPATALHRHPARYKAAAAAHVGRDIEHRALALAVHGGTSPRRHDVGARATGRRRAQLSDSRKGGNAGWKAAYRVAMQRWHPDKFYGQVLGIRYSGMTRTQHWRRRRDALPSRRRSPPSGAHGSSEPRRMCGLEIAM